MVDDMVTKEWRSSENKAEFWKVKHCPHIHSSYHDALWLWDSEWMYVRACLCVCVWQGASEHVGPLQTDRAGIWVNVLSVVQCRSKWEHYWSPNTAQHNTTQKHHPVVCPQPGVIHTMTQLGGRHLGVHAGRQRWYTNEKHKRNLLFNTYHTLCSEECMWCVLGVCCSLNTHRIYNDLHHCSMLLCVSLEWMNK